MSMSDSDPNEIEIVELSGHWHFYVGASLKSTKVDPICFRLDAFTEQALCSNNAEAWGFLIAMAEEAKGDP
jgi:hypothetical protein